MLNSNTNYQTTNKSDRDINMQFNENNNMQINKEVKICSSDDINNILPHQKPVQDIIINIREIFYKSLEMLLNKKNPIPYILSTPDIYFSFSILLIILGSLLLFFSNLLF